MEWTLFLDETGNFGADPAVAIAGLLLQHEAGDNLRRVWRRALDVALPAIAYPPHATDLLIPSAHLAEWIAASPERRKAHPDAARLADLAQVVERQPEATRGFAALVGRLRDGASATGLQSTLRRCDAFLQVADPDGYLLLELLAERSARRMKELLGETARIFGADRCFVVGAAEVTPEREAGGDRYLELLVPLFERIFALLRTRHGERHRIWIQVESRAVRDAVLCRQVALRPSDLGAAVREAEGYPFLAPRQRPDPHVRLVPAMPERKSADMHPGLVLADFIANRLRSSVGQNLAYERLDDGIFQRTGLRATAPARAFPDAGRLPAIAAQGPSRRFLLASLADRDSAGAADDEARGWMHEQAQAWVAIAGGRR